MKGLLLHMGVGVKELCDCGIQSPVCMISGAEMDCCWSSVKGFFKYSEMKSWLKTDKPRKRLRTFHSGKVVEWVNSLYLNEFALSCLLHHIIMHPFITVSIQCSTPPVVWCSQPASRGLHTLCLSKSQHYWVNVRGELLFLSCEQAEGQLCMPCTTVTTLQFLLPV